MGGAFLLIIIPRVGHSLIWPMRVCAAEQGMVFMVWVLNRVYDFTIKRPEQGFFLDRKSYYGSSVCKTKQIRVGK